MTGINVRNKWHASVNSPYVWILVQFLEFSDDWFVEMNFLLPCDYDLSNNLTSKSCCVADRVVLQINEN
jgi:hypothetical protein